MYTKVWKKSWSDLQHNLILVVPDLIVLFFVLGSIAFFLSISGLSALGASLQSLDETQQEAAFTMGKDFVINNFVKLIGYLIVWLTIMGVLIFLARAVSFGMMRDVIQKKKPSLRNAGRDIKKYFWKLAGLSLYAVLLFCLILVISSILFLIGSKIVFLIPLGFLVFIIGLAWLYAGLFYSKQIVVCKETTGWTALKESFNLFHQRKKITIKAILLLGVTMAPASILISLIGEVHLVANIISKFLFLGISVWSTLFTFHIYKHQKELT